MVRGGPSYRILCDGSTQREKIGNIHVIFYHLSQTGHRSFGIGTNNTVIAEFHQQCTVRCY